jgi:ATP-dependent Clp protease ATP-binding subunit ClpA/ATP-dependent Clp protease ATP-binding subunit ClpC
MDFTIPVYQTKEGQELAWYTLLPAGQTIARQGRSQAKLQEALTQAVRKVLDAAWPEELERWVMPRGMRLQHVRLELSLRPDGKRIRVSGIFPLILEPRHASPDQVVMVAYHPRSPERWFPYDTRRELAEQATIFFQHEWAEREQEEVEALQSSAGDRLHTISLRAKPHTLLDRLKREQRADDGPTMVGGSASQRRSGMVVLPQLGVNLTARAALGSLSGGMPRKPYQEQLRQLLCGKRKASVMVIGQSGVGKTTLIYRLIHDMLEAEDYGSHRNLDRVHRVWAISGRRMIAGMSYVGQWEQRCVDLLGDVQDRQVVLYVDDLHAWGRIGQSRESERSLADFFRGPIARGEVVVIGECTPEQWQRLEDEMPGVAQLFSRVHVEPTVPMETMRMMIHEGRRLEMVTGQRVHPLAYRTIYELGDALFSASAFPGKALDMLGSLTRQATDLLGPSPEEGTPIGPAHVIKYVSRRTGVPQLLLETSATLSHDKLREQFGRYVVGQPQAIEAVTSLVVRIKARLTDPKRPWGVFMFTGPTGTGKTELAKCLAEYLYGDEARLVRLDMSEYAAPGSASRLVGDRWEPEGVLTRQIRQQPFCVVLLDEIEKAHTSVLHLMLQLLDEGRLTDAAGNVADFTHAVIVMTSNLGARTSTAIGMRGADGGAGQRAAEQADVRRAVEAFFPPELFNRIDQVVPFGALTHETARAITEAQLKRLLSRRGLTERNVFVRVSEAVLAEIARAGFDARDGARSLKRYLEQHLTTLLVESLCEGKPGELRFLRVYQTPQGLRLYEEALREATLEGRDSALAGLLTRTPAELNAELPDVLRFLEETLESPALDALSGRLRAYLRDFNMGRTGQADHIYNLDMMRVQLRTFRDDIALYLDVIDDREAELVERELELRGQPELSSKDGWSSVALPAHQRRLHNRQRPTMRGLGRERLLELLAEVHFLRRALEHVDDAGQHAVFLEVMQVGEGVSQRRFAEAGAGLLPALVAAYARGRGELEGWAVHTRGGDLVEGKEAARLLELLAGGQVAHGVLKIAGLCVRRFFEGEHGCQVRASLSSSPEIVRVRVVEADAQTRPAQLIHEHIGARAVFEHALETCVEALPPNPEALLPVVRRWSFEPDADAAFHVSVEDFGLVHATERSVRALDEVLRELWLLKMGQ